ncbi:phosphoribosyl pyrophosphate synthase-associated protein 2-like [Anneissia japonica]|uniref:phosphoribosyl pyrophosphate synthase-associated protein 2-like n=1 Tax=Anneissia japonica TaxID=1529436 RepID=UPI0014258029|nr:phosphoribosyl pyrophosphate synthase-associated protein 2-like [Anneissia japonica]
MQMLPVLIPKEKPPINVVGDVGGKIAIIVDDMIDQAESFVAAAEILKERGAYKIYAMATHGLLSADAPKQIEESCIDEVMLLWKLKFFACYSILDDLRHVVAKWLSCRTGQY